MTFKVPPAWQSPPQQAQLIEILAASPGRFIPPYKLARELYGEVLSPDDPAPAKLRVLVQRTREVLEFNTSNEVTIGTKRNKGYRIAKSQMRKLLEIV